MGLQPLKIVFCVFLLGTMFFGCQSSMDQTSANAESDSLMQMVEKRIAEKKEIDDFRKRVLPADFKDKIEDYYSVIRKYAKRYGFDWRLIVVQILKESRFKENARSHVGAMGLMQIMPYTATDIANNPRENIAAGIYHLYKQLKYFPDSDPGNRMMLALAAYNCGVGHIFDAQDIARFLQMNPQKWDAVKSCLPKLTSDDWRLHLDVWELGVPQYGYFYGYDQTIDYVDDIIKNYQIIKIMY